MTRIRDIVLNADMVDAIDNYRPSYESAMEELRELVTELKSVEDRREVLIIRIGQVKKGIHALAPLCDGIPWETDPHLFPEIVNPKTGLSDAVWQILTTNPVAGAWISPTTIREQLKNVGYDNKAKNILPSIHNVLKRFVVAGKAEAKDVGAGKWYRCKTTVSNDSDRSEVTSRRER